MRFVLSKFPLRQINNILTDKLTFDSPFKVNKSLPSSLKWLSEWSQPVTFC